ncbi:uncharacterized protein PADG_05994 [Paracoccidioides brasiliensis Pb18]|uniref:L-ascorbate oxidase n=1 Tax=Paracoccidioides brasiliensis (strain Pb18) TaxID=502780 RepID=C1GFF8_PARBD|nr:uncharacterized protein PADG_05994 [Paracoccidioides brasiliensis Pb18]EEH49915.2 hypothetical protein PADG_05994 [Paracoccidioides brasiliensis Pb18]
MERPSSRRRIRGARNSQECRRVSPGSGEGKPSQGTVHWSKRHLAVVVISVISLVALFRVLEGSNIPGYLPGLALKEHVLDVSLHPATEELHPEDHIYRRATTIHLNWTVTAGDRHPDGVRKSVYLINGRFPGPTIEARSGDRLIINVKNGLADEGVSVHWHGLHMKDGNRMDGTTGVTQCAIAPQESFLYDFTISDSQSGTYWYHAHSGLQRADGLYGGLVIHRPAPRGVRGVQLRHPESDILRYNYQKEILLLVGDWYHRRAHDVLEWYMRAGSYGNEPVPDSLVINGAGHFNCAQAVPARPVDCLEDGHPVPYLIIDPTQSYRVRLVNTGSLAGISLGVAQGYLDVLHLDGGLDVQELRRPKTSNPQSIGILYPGQRVDFILRHHRNAPAKSSLTVELDPECFKYSNPALSSLQSFPIYSTISKSIKQTSLPQPLTLPAKNHIDLTQVSSTPALLSGLPPEADQTYVVYTKISKMSKNHNVPLGYFNHTSWRPQSTPRYPLIALDPHDWDKNQLAISTGSKPVWVDLVINNLDEGAHPFHLHGHDFFVLTLHAATQGWGSYNPFDPHPRHQQFRPSSKDLEKAVLRDTVQIPQRGHAVLRFRADNPGVWLLHCHILWHLAAGMAMVIDVMNGFNVGEKPGIAGGENIAMCQYF